MYTSAALVLVPVIKEIKKELRQLAKTNMTEAVTKWIECVENKSPHADAITDVIFSRERYGGYRLWSTSDECFSQCLSTVQRLGSVEIFEKVVTSLSNIKEWDAIVSTAQHFDLDKYRDLLIKFDRERSLPYRVSLLHLALKVVSNKADVAYMFDQLVQKPKIWPMTKPRYASYLVPYFEPARTPEFSPDLYTHVLQIAHRVSAAKLHEFTVIPDLDILAKTVVPAMTVFLKELASSGITWTEDITNIVRAITSQLDAMGAPRQDWSMPECRLNDGRTCCKECTEVQTFLLSPTQQSHQLSTFKTRVNHVRAAVNRLCGRSVTCEILIPTTITIRKVDVGADRKDKARRTADQWRSTIEGYGVVIEPSVGTVSQAVHSTIDLIHDAGMAQPVSSSSTRAIEVIEVDSD